MSTYGMPLCGILTWGSSYWMVACILYSVLVLLARAVWPFLHARVLLVVYSRAAAGKGLLSSLPAVLMSPVLVGKRFMSYSAIRNERSKRWPHAVFWYSCKSMS